MIRKFLNTNRFLIRQIVATTLRYSNDEVAFYPHCISTEDAKLADNLLPLEFVVDSGTNVLNVDEAHAARVEQAILDQCEGAAGIHFGVWIIADSKNGFVEHKPH